MPARLRPRLSYANVTATLCLALVVIGDTASAARSLLDGRSLRDGTVSSAKLAANSVTSPKVRNGTIQVHDLSGRARQQLRGAAGPRGEAGPQGERGPQGEAGPAGTFAGSFASPDGRYTISVTNAGIVLAGPASTLVLDDAGTRLRSGDSNLDLTPVRARLQGAEARLAATGTTHVVGGTVRLNNGSQPAARRGDLAQLTVPEPGTYTGPIINGSSTVFIG